MEVEDRAPAVGGTVWSADDINSISVSKEMEEWTRTRPKKKRVPRARGGETTLKKEADATETEAEGAKEKAREKGGAEVKKREGGEDQNKGEPEKKEKINEDRQQREEEGEGKEERGGKQRIGGQVNLKLSDSQTRVSPRPAAAADSPRTLRSSAPEKEKNEKDRRRLASSKSKERKARSTSDKDEQGKGLRLSSGSDEEKEKEVGSPKGKGKDRIVGGSGVTTTKKANNEKETPPASPPAQDATGRRSTISSSSSPISPRNAIAAPAAKEAPPASPATSSPAASALMKKQRERGALSDVVTTQEMMEATFGQDLKKLEYLWTRGASIDCHDETNGYTPLHWAIINDKARSVTWLLTHEAKVNAKDSMGWTPLHYAAHSSKVDVTRALIEHGASPSLKNNKGKLPADIAKSRVIVKLLKEAKDKEKGPSSRLSWFGFKTEGVANSADLIKKEGAKAAGSNGTLRRPVSPRSGEHEAVEESDERKKKRVDLDQRERELDDLRDGLTLKEKELYLKEQELTEAEQRVNSKEGWVGMREKELHKLEKRVDKQKEKLVSRERTLVEAEEKHRVAAISAAVQVIRWEELQLGDLLGSGGFADVYKADWRGDYVAVKVIKNQRDDDTFRLQFQQESLFLSKLRHYHVVQLMGVCVEYPHMSIVMELMTNDTLSHLLKAARRGETKIPAQLLLQLAREIAKGMNFLHMMDPPLIHRDLKPANILLDENLRVKIGDVGFVQTKDEDLREGAQDSFAGTPSYMAPECLRQEPYDQKSDVYSYGNVLWELLTLRKPWKGKKRMEIVALAGYNRDKLPMPSPHSLPEGVPAALLEIVARCWADVPSDRPSFSRLLTLLPSPPSP